MLQNNLFYPGNNIAIKTPARLFGVTIEFYRDVLGLNLQSENSQSAKFAFGNITLWIDCVHHLNEAEIWLEIRTKNTEIASQYLSKKRIERCENVEKLPDKYDGFWVRTPTALIHLISGPEA